MFLHWDATKVVFLSFLCIASMSFLKSSYPLDDADRTLKYYPLITAIITNKDLKTVKLLIDKGVNINQRIDCSGKTALHYAAIKNLPEIVQFLIDHKADIDSTNYWGTTPLMLAVQDNNMQAMEILLNNKADVNATNNQGRSPLQIAAEYGHSDAATALLKAHANPNK